MNFESTFDDPNVQIFVNRRNNTFTLEVRNHAKVQEGSIVVILDDGTNRNEYVLFLSIMEFSLNNMTVPEQSPPFFVGTMPHEVHVWANGTSDYS